MMTMASATLRLTCSDTSAHDAGVRVEQVLAAHARLARDAGRDDHDVRAGRVVVAVRAAHAGVPALDRRRLPLVEALALRHAFHDVDHDDFARQLPARESLRAVAPTLPAPTTVILLTMIDPVW
jgi:hypothetical protein